MIQPRKSYWQFQEAEWRKFVTFLVAANILTVAVPWVIYGLVLIIPTGESGLGYFFLLFALLGLGGMVAFVNIIAACTYLVTHKLNDRFLWFNILTILASAAYLAIVFGRWLFR